MLLSLAAVEAVVDELLTGAVVVVLFALLFVVDGCFTNDPNELARS